MVFMIVHVDSAMNWRGGQQQVYLLHRQLRLMNIESVVLTPKDSALLHRCGNEGLEAIAGSRPWHLFSKSVRDLINNCHILHVHDSPSATLAAMAKRVWPSLNVICHRRISFPLRPNHASRWKYRRVRHWLCVSPEIKQQLLAGGIEANKTSVVPSAIDTTRIMKEAAEADIEALRTELGASRDVPIITSIGALVPQKAHDLVIEAAAYVQKTFPEAIFLIVGEGNQRTQLEKQARELGLSDRIHFTGFRLDVPALLKLATISISASINGEGSPATIKEALCVGTAVIASDIEAHRLVLGEKGILKPVGDATSLGAAITTMLGDPDRRQKMARNAAKITGKFHPEAMAEATFKVYRRIIGSEEKM